GLAYAIDVAQPIGKRISHMTLLKTGKEIEPAKEYVVAGWASINEGTEGPAIWDVVASYVTKKKSITVGAADNVKITGI
ncbi:5'-nucleotidase C-terminal domain-containing protein, partial [Escherichia coli]|uniref:5'-nucleotidase C-terminal domain-containing protein n=1 Tax=Escherichia coli TaxID=562 RepID=UPI0027381325